MKIRENLDKSANSEEINNNEWLLNLLNSLDFDFTDNPDLFETFAAEYLKGTENDKITSSQPMQCSLCDKFSQNPICPDCLELISVQAATEQCPFYIGANQCSALKNSLQGIIVCNCMGDTSRCIEADVTCVSPIDDVF